MFYVLSVFSIVKTVCFFGLIFWSIFCKNSTTICFYRQCYRNISKINVRSSKRRLNFLRILIRVRLISILLSFPNLFFFILDDKCRGWWRLSDIEDVNQLEATLNSRGTREQHLLTLVKRNFELLQDAAKKWVVLTCFVLNCFWSVWSARKTRQIVIIGKLQKQCFHEFFIHPREKLLC